MNIRNVLRTYSLLRQLADDESALLETLRGMSETERESLVVALQPEKATTKRASKKSSKGESKSARASGMAAAINRSLSQGRQVVKDGSPCFATVDDNGGEMTCGKMEDDPAHDTRYLSSHPFVRDSRTAQPARGKSSTNGGAGSTTQGSEAKRENASTATGG